jgi:hypothetical protein
VDEAKAHLQQADRVLAAQPSLGPQFLREVDGARALLDWPA